MFIGRTEVPMFWPPDVKSQLTGEAPIMGKKGVTEDEMVGWRHQLSSVQSLSHVQLFATP